MRYWITYKNVGNGRLILYASGFDTRKQAERFIKQAGWQDWAHAVAG